MHVHGSDHVPRETWLNLMLKPLQLFSSVIDGLFLKTTHGAVEGGVEATRDGACNIKVGPEDLLSVEQASRTGTMKWTKPSWPLMGRGTKYPCPVKHEGRF